MEHTNLLIFARKDDRYYNETYDGNNICKVSTAGTYLMSNNRLDMSIKFKDAVTNSNDSNDILNFVFDVIPCLVYRIYRWGESSFGETESLVYDFILKNGHLYLENYEPDDSINQQCPNGTVLQKLQFIQESAV